MPSPDPRRDIMKKDANRLVLWFVVLMVTWYPAFKALVEFNKYIGEVFNRG